MQKRERILLRPLGDSVTKLLCLMVLIWLVAVLACSKDDLGPFRQGQIARQQCASQDSAGEAGGVDTSVAGVRRCPVFCDSSYLTVTDEWPSLMVGSILFG